MSNGGTPGVLLPAESLYREPGQAVAAARIEAAKRAQYLADMDQFYAQLEEQTREFDIQSAFRRDVFEFEKTTKATEEAMLQEDLALRQQRLELERQLGFGELGLRQRGLGLQERQQTQTYGLQQRRLELEEAFGIREAEQREAQLGFQEEAYRREQTLKEAQFGFQQEESAYTKDIFGRILKKRYPETFEQTPEPASSEYIPSYRQAGSSPYDRYFDF